MGEGSIIHNIHSKCIVKYMYTSGLSHSPWPSGHSGVLPVQQMCSRELPIGKDQHWLKGLVGNNFISQEEEEEEEKEKRKEEKEKRKEEKKTEEEEEEEEEEEKEMEEKEKETE